jgi:hypothetical protein
MRLATLVTVGTAMAVLVFGPAAVAAPAPGTGSATVSLAPSPAGVWQGAIQYDPGKVEIDVLVELAQGPEGRWAGTIDVLPLGIEYHLLEDISVEGSRVTFWLNRQSPNHGLVKSPFEGEVSVDGSTIEGEFVEGGQNHHPFVLQRIGEAGDPRPEPQVSELQTLTEAGDLREAFNAHRDAVRVVMLLSPT